MTSESSQRRSKRNGNRKKTKQQTTETKSELSNTIFDSLFENVNVVNAAGITVSVLALAASWVLLRSPNKKKALTGKGRKQRLTPGQMKHAKSAPTLHMTPDGNDAKEVPIELVSKMFQACLQSRGKEQKMLMDEFYKRIRSWNHDMLETSAQTIVVNFLFWYYRMCNTPITTFTSEQADYVRYWANYDLGDANLDYSAYNIKFDFMYSIALLQRSMPHMRQFWKFLMNTIPRQAPKAPEFGGGAFPSRKKDNYQLTKFQAACILGKWDQVKRVGALLDRMATEAAYLSPKDNYMLNYALRAMEMPQSNANFGQMYKIVDTLIENYDTKDMPPARFGVWQVHSFKYRNLDDTATPTDDSKFVVASVNMKDSDNWYHFYPALSRMVSMARIPREVKLWGRVAQIMSPMTGLSGCLPMTGTWSDLELYFEMEWTYRADARNNRCKHGILKLEREPIEEKVISTDVFGRENSHVGYKWKGTLTITVNDEEHPLQQKLFGAGLAGKDINNNGKTERREKRIRDLFGDKDIVNNGKSERREQRIRDLFGDKARITPSGDTTEKDTTTTTTVTKDESETVTTVDDNDDTTATTKKTDENNTTETDNATEKDNNNNTATTTTTTVNGMKMDEKTEENSEVMNNNKDKVRENEEIAVYEVELIISTDIEDSKNNLNEKDSPRGMKGTPRGNGIFSLGGDENGGRTLGGGGGPSGGRGGATEISDDQLRRLMAMMKAEKERQDRENTTANP